MVKKITSRWWIVENRHEVLPQLGILIYLLAGTSTDELQDELMKYPLSKEEKIDMLATALKSERRMHSLRMESKHITELQHLNDLGLKMLIKQKLAELKAPSRVDPLRYMESQKFKEFLAKY